MFAALKKQLWPDPEPWAEPKERPISCDFGRVVTITKPSRPVTPDGTEARGALAANAMALASVVAEIAKIQAKIIEIAAAGRVDENVNPEDAMSADAMAAALADPLNFDVAAAKTNLVDRLADAQHARLVGQPIIAALHAKGQELHREHARLTEESRHLVDAIIVTEAATLMAEAREAGQAIDDRLAALDGLVSHARGAGNGNLVTSLLAQRQMYPAERDARRNRSAGLAAKWRRWASLRLPNDANAIEQVSP